MGSAVQVYVPELGTANVRLTVVPPPVGCPCVVRVSSLTGSVVRTAGVALTGVPTVASAGAERPAQLRLAELVIVDSGGWAARFALPTRLALRLVLRNDGPIPAVDPVFSLLAGRPDRVTTIVSPPQLGTIPAGESRTYQLRVPLEAPVFGRYVVSGQIDGGDRPVAFVAETASYPWALLAVVGALMLLFLIRPRAMTWVTIRPSAD